MLHWRLYQLNTISPCWPIASTPPPCHQRQEPKVCLPVLVSRGITLHEPHPIYGERCPMDQRPLVEGYIANLAYLVCEFFRFGLFFSVVNFFLVLVYSWSTLLRYWCYYPHRSRDSMSPICGIFICSLSCDTIEKHTRWIHEDLRES